MDKKVIIIISSVVAVVILAALGIWLFVSPSSEQVTEKDKDNPLGPGVTTLEFSTPDLSLSGIDPMDVPNLDTTMDTDIELGGQLNLDIPAVTGEASEASVDAPDIKVEMNASDIDISGAFTVPAKPKNTGNNSSSSAPPSGPDAATCAQFASAPSCDYVPAEHRVLCEQCK